MSAGVVACSSCGYENVVVGCGFCLQCGTEFPVNAAIENETVSQESQITQLPSAASPEAIEPVATPADEQLAATATEADSQYAGLFGHNDTAENTLEEVSIDPPIPSGGTDAHSALFAEPENVNSDSEATVHVEEPIVAVEVIEQPNEWEMAVEPQLEETAESSAISFEPAESLSAAEQSVGIGDPPDETFGPVADTAQPAAEPTNEAVGVADEAAWPEAESTELADGDIAPVAERDEPVDEAVELFYEAAEPAGEPDPTQAESTSAPATDEEQTEAGFESTHNDGAETEVEKVEQISFSDSLSLELDRMIAAGAKSVDMQMSVSEQGLVGELEVNGRKQHVYVQRSYSSNGAPLLSFFAACGPASQQHALPLLEWNSALPMCAFAIREIENTAMFVVQANVPAFSLNQMSITTTFKEIAKRADQVQQRIG